MDRLVRPLLALALLLVLAAPAAGGSGNGDGDVGSQKASVDAKLATVQAKLARSKARAGDLSSQISSLTSAIHDLERQVGDVSGRLSALRTDIALHRRRLSKLDALYRLQTRRFHELRLQYGLAVRRLDRRLVTIYEEPGPTTIDLVVAAKSFQDLLDQVDYMGQIATQDRNIAAEVKSAKAELAASRRHTKAVRQTVRHETRVISGRAQQVAILQAELIDSRNSLARVRARSSAALASTNRDIRQEVGESKALQSASDELAAKLRAESQPVPSANGRSGTPTFRPAGAPHFIWPVSGPITSPFGMRWGTLHPGIDIGVPTGTPVHASAAGKVVWCGWMSGYGNLVMIDHGGGYATAYGHNSRVIVSCGQEVAQGQVVSYSGCTGFCTGPHVHFEIRINGTPVDPLGFLG
jgi:murein DD-endopeptidase MepM/ murein hydrolase activator NlpD